MRRDKVLLIGLSAVLVFATPVRGGEETGFLPPDSSQVSGDRLYVLLNDRPNPSRLMMLSPTTGAVLDSLSLGAEASGSGELPYDPNRRRLYIAADGKNLIYVVDTVTNALVDSIPSKRPYFLGITYDGGTLISAGHESHSFSILNAETGKEERRVDAPLALSYFAISKSGRVMFGGRSFKSTIWTRTCGWSPSTWGSE